MNDSDLVVQAYEDTVRLLFSRLFDACVVAKDADEQAQAEQRFQTGVRKARETRDRAIALLS